MQRILRHTLIFAIVSITSFTAPVSAFTHNTRESSSRSSNLNSEKVQQRQLASSQRGVCGTEEPTTQLKDAHKRLSLREYRHAEGSIDGNASRATADSLPRIEVDTWFHVVSTSEKVGLVTNTMIASQFLYLQQAYQNSSIHYNLIGVDRSINDTWARNGDSAAMKRTLRKGSYSALNVYFQTDLEVSDASGASSRRNGHHHHHIQNLDKRDVLSSQNLLGFCTLPNPEITSSSSIDDYFNDGCNILASTMPGGSIEHYNRGGTTVHEVGHWHGLLHTFQDQTCAPGANGDYISDTPQQSVPTEGCPASKDSCSDLPGMDAIWNFMDYSSDDCYRSFTVEQASRMRSMWATMREGK
ncbi:metalloprotease MEP1 [Talaromyces stipitatus ATCC 10500]|uniref:Metalloprotease MEP1 n=1 Tax=Talaromyces stipitatus (strain ATCC 10500 / CBS 375.48 / QM 6759 / NRRL 1006) TaxID=441959 RepID=B8MIK7_TALSN|nr:metalloprotease MEP1 [Talaromyces stipitatus ATCC 10500]EED15099.1 metalloprotease MEP1 [Talaromyces stipitatus ATCC 10500]